MNKKLAKLKNIQEANERILGQNNHEDIVDILMNPNDGPVNRFVVIARAVSLAAKEKYYDGHNYTADDIANALDMSLDQLESQGGNIDSNERTFGY